MELGIVIGLYFVPWIIAAARNHHNHGAICALNLLLGWTLLGWIAAFVWAFTSAEKPQKARKEFVESKAATADIVDEIERLRDLRDDGEISEDEFQELKTKAMNS